VIIEGGPHRGAPAVVSVVVAGAAEAIVLAFPLPLALPLAFATVVGVWGRRGGPPEDTAVPTVVGAEAAAVAEGALHLRARSKTRRPIPGLPSGPAQSP
jgi:hypothetical protein